MVVVFEPSLIKSQPTVTKFFSSAIEQGKLAHAYLFVGGSTSDKWLTVRQIAMYLNCTDQSKERSGSCGVREMPTESRCQSCRWIQEGKHPSAWFELKDSESTTTIIPVERARLISQELSKTSSYKRVIVVEDASQEVFHRPAANALLKTIEEPRGVMLFAFFARTVEQVLTTVVSRCQVVPFRRDGEEMLGPLAQLTQGRSTLIPSCLSASPDLIPHVATMKERHFFDWSRALTDKRGLRRHDAPSESENAIATLEALEFGKMLVDLIEDEHDMDAVIDAAILTELQIIGNTAINEPSVSFYLVKLNQLAEQAKAQLGRYVTKKAAIDSFVQEWINLRRNLVVQV